MQYDASGCVLVEAGQERFGKVFGILVSPNPTNFVLAMSDLLRLLCQKYWLDTLQD
jgi:hypothetical protein